MTRYCPVCKKQYSEDYKFCPQCEDENGMPVRLVEEPTVAGFGVTLGDANAISGGIHNTDSHNVDSHEVHTTMHNTTNNVTNYVQQVAKNAEESAIEKKFLFRQYCEKIVQKGGLISAEGKALLDRKMAELGLSQDDGDAIVLSIKRSKICSSSELNILAKIKLDSAKLAIKQNSQNLERSLSELKAQCLIYDNEELHFYYNLLLSALDAKQCILRYEARKADSYWMAFWAYLAYIKLGDREMAEQTLAWLSTFDEMPQGNLILLDSAGRTSDIIGNENSKETQLILLNEVSADCSDMLADFNQSLIDIYSDKMEKPDFFAEHFSWIDSLAREAEDKKRKEDAERKAKEESERKEKEEAERKAREEAERLAHEEAEKKRKEETERKAKEEAELKAKDEAKLKSGALKETKLPIPYSQDFLDALDYYDGLNGKKRDYTKAIELLKRASCSSNLTEAGYASNMLGVCYNQGLGVAKDYAKAMDYFLQSAKANDCVGAMNAGIYYENGNCVKKNSETAKKYYSTSLGLAEDILKNSNDIIQLKRANVLLGDCYQYAIGVKKDLDRAVSYYKQAESLGQQFIAGRLGNCFDEKGDFLSAVSYLSEAANNGDYYSIITLADYYQFGKPSIDINLEKAQSLYEKASKLPEDQNNNHYAKSNYEYLLNPPYFSSERITAEMQDDKILLIVLNDVKVSGINGTFHIQCKFYSGRKIVSKATENRLCRDKSQKVFERIDIPFSAELLVPDLGTRYYKIKVQIDYMGQIISESDFINITISCSRSLFKKAYRVSLSGR